jgi:DNA repair protein RecN (Recombination protein N)
VARRCQAYRALDERLAALTAETNARAERLALLHLQVDELDVLGLTAEEIEELDREQRRLANLGALQETSGRVLERIYDADSSLHGGLTRTLGELEDLLRFDERLGEIRELLEGAAIQVEEAASGLRQYLGGLELDPSLMASVETRLGQVHDLARKYRVFPQQIPDTLVRLREELAALEADDAAVGGLAGERDAAREGFLAEALELSERRVEAAGRLSEAVTGSMQELGMAGGRFEVRVIRGDADSAGSHGLDRVELLVSANPGQPLRPLAKVASGGELSRISLCIQVAAAQCAGIPTLVFDEVDVGIGGAVAEIVGRLLRTLGASRQVICVTHLPQVAAQADGHLVVRKHSPREGTYTEIAELDEEARVAEIARMLGGTEITAKAVAHARELIERRGANRVREGEQA